MTTIISNSYASLQDNLNHLKCLKLKYFWGIMLQNYLLWYWYMLSNLRATKPLILYTSAISLTYLRSILILDSISVQLRNIRRLNSLLINFIFLMRISCNTRSSFPMGPLFKRLWVNTVTLLHQSGGNPLILKKSLKMIICLWIFLLGQLKNQSPRMWINMVSKSTAVGKTLTLVESDIPIQLQLFTSVGKRAI